MRVGLRLLYNEGWMGGVNYVLNIARMLRSLPENERPHIIFLTAASAAEEIARKHAYLADEIAPIERANELKLDFVYPATQIAEAPYDAPWGGWIPDWQCRHYPELFAPEERIRRFLQYRTLAEGPAVCVFSSQQAIADTHALLGSNPTTRRHVFHFPAVIDAHHYARPAADIARTRARFGVPERYLIVCNQFWKHKNHLIIVEALALAPEIDLHVVMTGALDDERWPDYAAKVRGILERPEVADRITITGRIDRADQLDLMLGAGGIIQPSLFEGWSTFVEEARALGLPGLLSDIPVHREQSPAGCQFFDPTSAQDLAQKLDVFYSAPPERIPLMEAQRNQQEYALGCARQFMHIAADCTDTFDPALHETVAILARVLPQIKTEVGATNVAQHYAQIDYDRFLAGVRMSLRSSPEALARLAGYVCASDNPYAEEALRLVILATLAKCRPEDRRRFFEFDPASLTDTSAANTVAAIQRNARQPVRAGHRFVENAFFRARDFVKRKLPVQP